MRFVRHLPRTPCTRISRSVTLRRSLSASGALALLISQSACTTADAKRITYEMLSQEDCLRNELDDFCARGYTHEYQEYERVRLDYLRHIAEEADDDTDASGQGDDLPSP